MLILVQQQAIIKAPPTLTDSLKHSLAQMQVKIDSMERVVFKTEIGSSFFSDALSTNLALFGTIIGLSALISWAFITKVLYVHQQSVNKATKKRIDDFSEEYDVSLNEIKNRLLQTNFDASRGMYFASIKGLPEQISLYWAMMTVGAYIIKPHVSKKTLQTWLDIAFRHAKKITFGDNTTTKFLKKYTEILDEVDSLPFSKDLESLLKLKNEVLSIVYSRPPAVPDNIDEVFPDEGS